MLPEDDLRDRCVRNRCRRTTRVLIRSSEASEKTQRSESSGSCAPSHWCGRICRANTVPSPSVQNSSPRYSSEGHVSSVSAPLLLLEGDGAFIEGRYRYVLWRTVAEAGGSVLFVMLNPSTADDQSNDPTIRRCMGFARSWGFSRLIVCNLFALRTSDPDRLLQARSPIGIHNDRHIQAAASLADRVVVAWGARGNHLGRADSVLALLRAYSEPHALRTTMTGQPAHPLYLPKNLVPVPLSDSTA